MSSLINQLFIQMIKYYEGDSKRIHHFSKVYTYAKLIAEEENLDKHSQFIVEAAALVHDIGIKQAEAKYNSCAGIYQEQEGGPIANELLTNLGFDKDDIEKICYIVSNHHHYDNIDSIEYQIVVEADFIVNFYEDNLSMDLLCQAYDKIFKTNTGCMLAEDIYKIK